MKRIVLVVSDLHLGGPEGFQMCSPVGLKRLTQFLGWARELHAREGGVHLVVAGDAVDFLAEPDDDTLPRERWTWSAFAGDESLALSKLERILERTAAAWTAMADFVRAAGELTVLLGNHDVELSLPRVRRRFLEAVASSGGRIEFLYDGEALTLGELVIEHGNRYEGWNAVAHDSLRHVRSALSRGEAASQFKVQPGSRLVAEVMNRIKAKYAFVDLLKPETSTVLPILAVLDAAGWRGAGRAIAAAARAAWRQSRRAAGSEEYIAAPETPAQPSQGRELMGGLPSENAAAAAGFPDEDMIALADELVQGTRAEEIGAIHDLEVHLLLQAFRARRQKDEIELAVDREATVYRKPAEALARAGHRVVVFGHNHHAKRVVLGSGEDTATYLNTGTWADLMCLPPAIYEGSPDEGERALVAFLEAVQRNDIAAYRRQLPTFARVDLDGERAVSSGVFFFDEGRRPEPISTEGVLTRLGGRVSP